MAERDHFIVPIASILGVFGCCVTYTLYTTGSINETDGKLAAALLAAPLPFLLLDNWRRRITRIPPLKGGGTGKSAAGTSPQGSLGVQSPSTPEARAEVRHNGFMSEKAEASSTTPQIVSE